MHSKFYLDSKHSKNYELYFIDLEYIIRWRKINYLGLFKIIKVYYGCTSEDVVWHAVNV